MTIVAITRQAPWLIGAIKAMLAGRTIELLAPYKPWPTRGILAFPWARVTAPARCRSCATGCRWAGG